MKTGLLVILMIIQILFTGCQTKEPTEDSTNIFNNSTAIIEDKLYFTNAKKDLYMIDYSDELSEAVMISDYYNFDFIEAHGKYIYFYSSNLNFVFRLDPADAESGTLIFNITDEYDEYHECLIFKCYQDSLYMNFGELGGVDIFSIKNDPDYLENPNTTKTPESMSYSEYDIFVPIIDPIYDEGLESVPEDYFWIYKSNRDDKYTYFVTEDGCQRTKNDDVTEEYAWENIEAYFPERYTTTLDINGDWIYYDYGESGKARVNRNNLDDIQVIIQ